MRKTISTVKSLAERIAPRLIWKRRIKSWPICTGEPEEALLPSICDPKKISLDIGAAAGHYLAHMIPHSARVIAFEPRKDAARELRRLYGGTAIVAIEEVALSDQAGIAQIRVPQAQPMLSTIDPLNTRGEGSTEAYSVKKKRLDDYAYRNVGFVKIDVEGHEQAVLAGAKRLFEHERPAVLIEAEERHHAGSVAAVRQYFEALGYAGYFLMDGELHPLTMFNLEKHQNPAHLHEGRRTGLYINNFLFLRDGQQVGQAGRS